MDVQNLVYALREAESALEALDKCFDDDHYGLHAGVMQLRESLFMYSTAMKLRERAFDSGDEANLMLRESADLIAKLLVPDLIRSDDGASMVSKR